MLDIEDWPRHIQAAKNVKPSVPRKNHSLVKKFIDILRGSNRMSSESEDDMTKILSNSNLTKRASGYFLPGRSVPLTTIELLYVSIIDGEEVDTTLEITAEIRNDELRIYRLEGQPEAVDEFVSPRGIEAVDYQKEIIRQLTEEIVIEDSVPVYEAEDLEVKFLCLPGMSA